MEADPRKKNPHKMHQALKILLPLSAFNHSRSSGVYDRSGIFLSSTLKHCDLYKFFPPATVSPCGCVNVAVGKKQLDSLSNNAETGFYFSPFLRRMTYTACCTPPFEYSRALLEACYGNIEIFLVPMSARIQLKMD